MPRRFSASGQTANYPLGSKPIKKRRKVVKEQLVINKKLLPRGVKDTDLRASRTKGTKKCVVKVQGYYRKSKSGEMVPVSPHRRKCPKKKKLV